MAPTVSDFPVSEVESYLLPKKNFSIGDQLYQLINQLIN
jgi:hypothetical protein